MESLDLQDADKTAALDLVSVGKLSELTGFPIDYIKRELLLDGEDLDELCLEELRKRVLLYLDSNF